jgi:hypothetical protein
VLDAHLAFVLQGLIVPHAPVLLADRGYPEILDDARRIRMAASRLVQASSRVVIIVSPHGADGGVLSAASGSLDGFGMNGFKMIAEVDADVAGALSRAWGRPLRDLPADHGAVVPFLLLESGELPVVVAAIREVSGTRGTPEPAIADGASLAAALNETVAEIPATVVLSAHTSAALSDRAPLLDRPAGHRLHRAVVHALESDIGLLREIGPDLWREAGSCGAGPLTVAGHLWAGRPARILAAASSTGVGYIVADIQPGDAK